MTPADLPAWFDGLPEGTRELLAAFGEQGFEEAAAVIGLIGEDPERPEAPTIKINNPQVTRPWPYDGPEGRARLTGSLDTGGSFTGDDNDDDHDDPESRQSTTACCPRQTIPDSCSCSDGCQCLCRDCDCGGWGEEPY